MAMYPRPAKRTLDPDAREAADEVFSNPDLLRVMCLGNLAPSNFAVLRRVCRSFKVLLDNDDAILSSVLRYQGGMTKTDLRSLMCYERDTMDRLPCLKTQKYHLYNEPAFKMMEHKGFAQELAARRRGPVGRKLRSLEAMWRVSNGTRYFQGIPDRSRMEEQKARKFGARKSEATATPTVQRRSPVAIHSSPYVVTFPQRALRVF